MARRGEESSALPSFFQNNPWLDILAQRGAEPTRDFVAPRASSAPVVKRATPVIEPEPIASSPTTPPAVSFPKELVVRLEVSPELIKAVRELKETIIMALSVSQRQAAVIPIYMPISLTQLSSAQQSRQQARAPGEIMCPKCGRLGKLYKFNRGRRTYILVLHGQSRCYLGPENKVKAKWPSLVEQASGRADGGRLGLSLGRWWSRVQIPAAPPPTAF